MEKELDIRSIKFRLQFGGTFMPTSWACSTKWTWFCRTFPFTTNKNSGSSHLTNKRWMDSMMNTESLPVCVDIFEGRWGILGTKLPKLKQLYGGFASVFPGASTIESDFSVTGRENNEYWTGSLTDFSLEDIFSINSMKPLPPSSYGWFRRIFLAR